MPQSRRRPSGRRDTRVRRADVTSAAFWRMVRNPDRRIPYVLTEEALNLK